MKKLLFLLGSFLIFVQPACQQSQSVKPTASFMGAPVPERFADPHLAPREIVRTFDTYAGKWPEDYAAILFYRGFSIQPSLVADSYRELLVTKDPMGEELRVQVRLKTKEMDKYSARQFTFLRNQRGEIGLEEVDSASPTHLLKFAKADEVMQPVATESINIAVALLDHFRKHPRYEQPMESSLAERINILLDKTIDSFPQERGRMTHRTYVPSN